MYSTDPRNISHYKTYSNSKLAANHVRNTHVLVYRLPSPSNPQHLHKDCSADAKNLKKKNHHTHVYYRLAAGKHLARDLENCVTSICLWRLVLPPMADCRLLTTLLHPHVFGRPRRIHSCSLSYDRYIASSKSSYPHSAI